MRRSALRKLGMTSGMALFGVFAIDDLARLAVKKLAQHQETKAIADSIAHDFKDMGVAFAADDGCIAGCVEDDTHDCVADDCYAGKQRRNLNECKGCVRTKENIIRAAFDIYENCQDEADKLGMAGSDKRNDALAACYETYANTSQGARNGYVKCCSTFYCTC